MISLSVLHVDDDPDTREVVKMSLGLDPAFTVRSCASGEEALAVTLEWSPDLVLLDVVMPDMDGPTTFACLRGRPQTVNVPIVFMTASAQTREFKSLMLLCASGVIAKPFDPMTLASLVRHFAPGGSALVAGECNPRKSAGSLSMIHPSIAASPTEYGLRGNSPRKLTALHRENQQLRKLVVQLSALVIKRVREQYRHEIKLGES